MNTNHISVLKKKNRWRTFNIHGTFSFYKRFFRLLKCCPQKKGSIKNSLLKQSLETQNGSSVALLWKPSLFFKSVGVD